MENDHFDALSPMLREAVHSALRSVLGPVLSDAVRPVTGGATAASVFCVEAGGRRYLLRIEGPASPLRNPHQYISMRIASDAGIAPRLHYVDENSRVAITDFIEQQPLQAFPGGPAALAHALGELLRWLQATPAFPYFVDYPDIVARLWAHVGRTGLFVPGLLDPFTERLESIREAYIRGQTGLVSSHNDSIPGNILFDGQRLWLIDWESAYRNDPLVDVAIVLDNLARTPELENILLQAWLGRIPDESIRSRLKLTRALTRLYYAGVCFSASAAASPAAPDSNLAAPTTGEFEEAIRQGRLRRGAPETKHVLGKMFLAAFFLDVPTPGFDAAV